MALWDEDARSPPVSLDPDIEEKLREHGPHLIRSLEPSELFWAEMFKRRVLSDHELRDLKSFQQPTVQIGQLIDKLHCVPVYMFHRFLLCLHATRQDKIIRTLGFNPEDYSIPMTRKAKPMTWHKEGTLEDGSKCDKIPDVDSKFFFKSGSAAERYRSCRNCNNTVPAETGNFCGNCRYTPKQQSTLGPSQTPSQAASSLVRVPVHQEANLQTSYIDPGGIQDKITMVRDENSEGIYEVIDDPTVDEQMASLYLSPVSCLHGEQHPSIDPNCTPDTLLPRDQTLKQDQQGLQGFLPQNPKGKGDEIPQLPLDKKRNKPLKKIMKFVRHPISTIKKKISKKKQKKPVDDASAMTEAGSETTPSMEKKDIPGPSSTEVEKPSTTGKILEHLQLTSFFPGKISLQMIMTLCPETPISEEGQNQNYAMQFLRKLMMLDNRARDQDSSTFCKKEGENPQNQRGASSSAGGNEPQIIQDPFEVMFSDIIGGEDDPLLLNPLDVFLTIFHCCDLLLRQVVAQKMSMCRLAIPFIVPDLFNDSYKFALWALRGIVVEWKTPTQKTCESSVVSMPSNVVSFVRVGRPHFSKSKLMNKLLSDYGHNTFCNVESPQGNRERMISDSFVEASWFLPAGKKTDFLKDVTMLLNLRGDASICKESIEVLSKISDVMVACVCPTDLTDERNLRTLLDIHEKCSKVVVMVVEKDIGKLDITKTKQQLQSYETHIAEEKKKNMVLVTNFNQTKQKNLDEIKQDMASALAKTIPENATKSIQDSCKAVDKENYSTDEMNTPCQSGKELAEKVMESFPNGKDVKKSDLLPLQACWVEWSKLLKEQKRAKGATTLNEKDILTNKMNTKRKQQLEISKHQSPLMTRFLSGLQQCKSIEDTHFYLQWLKLSLDDQSRKILPALRKELTIVKESKGTKSIEAKTMAEDLNNASVGLEHFFREIGQIYEAVKTSRMQVDQNMCKSIDSYPVAIAKLIHSGFPLEIMDGNASNVPITWLKAVLSAVKKLVGNSKVVVLSVLGIQSSGKSTLLNAMFGLHFAVSAGRCTQGVYAQLVSMHGYGSTLPFEYILVVDTEGLRAPEIFESDYHHDNELATFVVGLGDMTLINIKGENVEEIKDILQIVAHAFLRMKLISQGSEHQKTCMFVHQNVPAIDAISKMMDGNMTLTATLDKIVEEVAIAERQEHIKKFSQLLTFDLHKQMWCLSDLFIGDPPMAPVNPGYSECVQKIKSEIIAYASYKQTTHPNFRDLTDRLKNIWDAILSEDFVFSFRNSRAARAYAALDTRYANLHWKFEKEIREWKYNIAKPKLEMCSTNADLQRVGYKLKEELQSSFRIKITEACKQFEEIFQGEWKDILIQWKTEKISSLDMALSLVVRQIKADIEVMENSLSFDIKQNADHEVHVQTIIEKAQQLASDLNGLTNERILKANFEWLWEDWVRRLSLKSELDDLDVYREVCNALRECFPARDQAYLGRELQCQNLDDKLETLVGSFKVEAKESKTWYEQGFAWIYTQVVGQGNKATAQPLVDLLLKSITDKIMNIVSRDVNFDRTVAKEIINYIIELCENKVDNAHWETNLSKMQVQIAVLACRYAIPHFKAMHERDKNKNSIKMKMEEYKSMTYKIFEHSVLQSGNEVIAADLLMNETMERGVKKRIIQDLNFKISDHLRAEVGCIKYALMVKILKHLASNDNFPEYIEYIYDSKEYAKKWLHAFGNDMFFNERKKFFEFAKAIVQRKIHSIETAIKEATKGASKEREEKSKTNAWLTKFSECLRDTVTLNTNEMQQVMKYTFSDVYNLQKLLTERLKEMERKILAFFQSVKYEAVEWVDTKPYELVCDTLWGCSAQCPFCTETCQKTDANHSEAKGDCHECLQHRPDGVSGMHFVESSVLSLESCSFAVHNKSSTFRCEVTRLKGQCDQSTPHSPKGAHYYHDYKSAHPQWDIAPSATMDSSTYWKWFFAKYQDDLTNYYKLQKPDIPPSWLDITQEEAVDSLATEFSGWH